MDCWHLISALLTAALIAWSSGTQSAAACQNEILLSTNGSVSCPLDHDSGSRYAANLDTRWFIGSEGAKVIKFSKVDVESKFDSILIYENTNSPESDLMRFRINSSDAVGSEFWMPGKSLVRFLTDNTIHRTGFKLSFETKNETIMQAATEVIKQRSGYRVSHPGFGSTNNNHYPKNYKLAWSIHVPNGSLLTIRFSAFNTQVDRDFLRIFPGSVPAVGNQALHEFSGSRNISELKFAQSITLLFTTGGSSSLNEGFVFEFSVTDSTACSERVNLTAEEGTVNSYSHENFQAHNSIADLCWLIDARGFVAINFHKLDIESCCDRVHIYANSDVPNEEKEALQLSNSEAAKSEFWLAVSGTVLIRFRHGFSNRKTWIQFAYRTNSKQVASTSRLSHPRLSQTVDFSRQFLHRFDFYSLVSRLNAAIIEQIGTDHGSRSSVSGYRSFDFALSEQRHADSASSSSAVYIWSINSMINQVVTIRFSNLSANLHQGRLEVFSGKYPTIGETSYWNLFEEEETVAERHFLGGATIKYTTPVSAYHSGFDFEFNVGRRIYPEMKQWSGKIFGNSSIDLFVQSSAAGASAECLVKPSCGNETYTAKLTQTNQQYLIAQYSIKESNLDSKDLCISGLRCTLTWPSGLPRRLESDVELASPYPESAIIELTHFGLMTGVVLFRVVSQSACPTVRHQCELRTTRGGIRVAQLVKLDVSEPTGSQCLSSVISQFSVVAELSVIAGSVIKCQLLNGSPVQLELPQPNVDSRLVKVWERPLLAASSTVAVLTIIVLAAVVCILLVSRRRMSKDECSCSGQKCSSQKLKRSPKRGNKYDVVKDKSHVSEIYLN